MATMAARDFLRVVGLSEDVAGIALLASCQALDLRKSLGEGNAADLHRAVREVVPRLGADRRMDNDHAAVVDLLRSDRLPLGDTRLDVRLDLDLA